MSMSHGWMSSLRERLSEVLLPRADPAPAPELELDDVQGLIVYGYKHMQVASFLVLKLGDAGQARTWLRDILKEELTTAARIPREERERRHACLNLAFTWQGLKALGLDEDSLQTFPYEFRRGMAERAHVLGDTGFSAPKHWDFGGTHPGGPPLEDMHLLLMLYARTPDVLSGVLAHQRERLEARGIQELYCQPAHHLWEESHGKTFFREPFGFRDDISQPVVQGFREHARPSADDDGPIATGEFLLGHENEYQEKPHSPSVPASLDVQGRLSDSPEPGRKDLGLNGTYLVMRKLRQDVEGFQAFVEKSRALAEGCAEGDEQSQEWLKAKLIGRWPNGEPLRLGERQSPAPNPHGPDNAFRFTQEDAAGLGCPVTSHVRRANPRDSLAPDPVLSLRMSRRHRLLRRGIPYEAEPRSDGGTTDPGLIFIALNTDFGRQFEFIQQSWLNFPKLGRMSTERDPVASTNEGGEMTIPVKPVRRCVKGLQHFVTLKGGGYFFVPGVRALEFLAHLKPSKP